MRRRILTACLLFLILLAISLFPLSYSFLPSPSTTFRHPSNTFRHPSNDPLIHYVHSTDSDFHSNQFLIYNADWPSSGLSNQLLAFQRAADVAVRYNRTLIVIPPADAHHDMGYTFSRMFKTGAYTYFGNTYKLVWDKVMIAQFLQDFKGDYFHRFFKIIWSFGALGKAKRVFRYTTLDQVLEIIPTVFECWTMWGFQIGREQEEIHSIDFKTKKFVCVGPSFQLSPGKLKEIHVLEEPIHPSNYTTPLIVAADWVEELSKRNYETSGEYVGVHLRMGDWEGFCDGMHLNRTKCWPEEEDIVRNVGDVKRMFGLRRGFISTNDAAKEKEFMGSGWLALGDWTNAVEGTSVFKGLDGNAPKYVIALMPSLLSQHILSRSKAFIGNYYSSFSLYVQMIRLDGCLQQDKSMLRTCYDWNYEK